MLKIQEILRLKYEAKLSNRKIARALNISHSAVNDYIKEFSNSGKKYEDVASLNDNEIKALLKANNPKPSMYPVPDFSAVHIKLRNKIVTLNLLYEEYIETAIITLKTPKHQDIYPYQFYHHPVNTI